MNCPRCNGKATVLETTQIPDDGVVYRSCMCVSCEHNFYTAELVVEFNTALRSTLEKYRGSTVRSRKRRKMSTYSKWVKVRCVDTGEIFESVSDAARSIDVAHSSIVLCCQGKRKTAGGKRWEYYNEKEVKEDES